MWCQWSNLHYFPDKLCTLSVQWTPGQADSFPARKAQATKAGRFHPARSRQAQYLPDIVTFLLWVVLLPCAVAKILSWNFYSAVNIFLGYKYYFCLLLILESIFFLSLFLYVKELCLFPGKKSRVAPQAAIITNSQVTFSWQISLY